jgi:hypothetical protein
MVAQAPANVQAVSAGNHDVQQKQRRRPALGVGNHIGGGVKQARIKSRGFQVMLHQPRDIGVVFQYKYGLAQTVCPRPAAVDFQMRRPHGTINRVMQPGKEIANVV